MEKEDFPSKNQLPHVKFPDLFQELNAPLLHNLFLEVHVQIQPQEFGIEQRVFVFEDASALISSDEQEYLWNIPEADIETFYILYCYVSRLDEEYKREKTRKRKEIALPQIKTIINGREYNILCCPHNNKTSQEILDNHLTMCID